MRQIRSKKTDLIWDRELAHPYSATLHLCYEVLSQASNFRRQEDAAKLTCLNAPCRSTSARHAAKPYQAEGHPDAQEKLKHYILSTRL